MDGAPIALLPRPGGSRLVIVRFDDRKDSLMERHVRRFGPIGDHLGRRSGQRVVKGPSTTLSANGSRGGLREATVSNIGHIGLLLWTPRSAKRASSNSVLVTY
jgi:hypothetical protein